MYLLSWTEHDAKIEASLGGRVTAEELVVFSEEIQDVMDGLEGRPIAILIDHSRAHRLGPDAVTALSDLKDGCLARGATQIVSLARDEDEVADLTNTRLMNVLAGIEVYRVAEESPVWLSEETAVVEPLRKAA